MATSVVITRLLHFLGRASTPSDLQRRLLLVRKTVETSKDATIRQIEPYLRNLGELQSLAGIAENNKFVELFRCPGCDLLSRKEALVVTLLYDGLRPAEVARVLGVLPETVERHIADAYRKLGLHRRRSLIELLEQYKGNE